MSWNINSYIVHKVHRCIKQPLEVIRNCVIAYFIFSSVWTRIVSHEGYRFCIIAFVLGICCFIYAFSLIVSVVLTHGHAGQLSGGPTSMLIYVCCVGMFFFNVETLILSQYNKYMFNFIDHLPVSGCVSKRSSALLCPRTYNTVDSVFFVLYPDV